MGTLASERRWRWPVHGARDQDVITASFLVGLVGIIGVWVGVGCLRIAMVMLVCTLAFPLVGWLVRPLVRLVIAKELGSISESDNEH